MTLTTVHLCNFSAKLEANALPPPAIATVKAMAEKLIDSLKLMGWIFAAIITPTLATPQPALRWAGARCGYDEGHTSALAQEGTLTRKRTPGEGIS